MAEDKEVVITVHGVNPDRGWQRAVHEVLEPHFACIAHDYPDYDTVIGPVRAVSNVWLLAISGMALLLGIGAAVLGIWWMTGYAALVFAIAFPLGLVLGWRSRVACTKRLMRHIADKVQSGSPHVIAHSLGTYLVGRVIRKYTSVTFANVLLVSCVLPRDFAWGQIVKERPRSIRAVRNEFGTSDWVVKTLRWISWLARDLGTAGDRGFHEVRGLIHTLPTPVRDCPACDRRRARVHNAPLQEYGHSEVFLGRRHARELWLPFLWGFPADELNEYLENLRTAARAILDRRWNDAEQIMDRLLATRFAWTRGRTLREAVVENVKGGFSFGFQLPDGLSIEQVVREVRLSLPRYGNDCWHLGLPGEN
ncbi:MAG TPA: hypothetical protein VKE24_06335 [Candidatus Acidoferrales bacterium]|nr:hypothetical protein [Candidatus Acidoferrales bacterium]